MKGTEFTLVF